uniref:Putative ribonuclease H-like domain-containing protein n=1 Tax=Tanacetum cinerariifolium TaxID=118510 RepID=A0A699JN15_TANCI|nr:putative ribonuclease H-like domain-containing protein [Tanacetum cinerariifolium]
MMASSPICLLSKASKTKSWLWHRRLSHLNFGAINHLARQGLVRGTVKFRNDHVAKIMGYGDYKIGNVTISKVYFVEGIWHNLFSVGQFCDSDLEVAFRQHTCFIRNLDGVDLLTGSRGNNLYTLSLGDMMASLPICLLSKASNTKSWIWHRRLSHLNFSAINHLAKQGLVRGLPKLKFEKEHLCSTYAMGKSKNKSHKPKSKDTNQEKLYLLHIDLYGPMHVESVNGKKYILLIVDDYSRFTWVKFLRSKDETSDFIIKQCPPMLEKDMYESWKSRMELYMKNRQHSSYMASLADKAILLGAENHPPMPEKDMYDSWRSRMELYMLNRQHGRMILESVEHAEAIQADCDVKATNIILQALPVEN